MISEAHEKLQAFFDEYRVNVRNTIQYNFCNFIDFTTCAITNAVHNNCKYNLWKIFVMA